MVGAGEGSVQIDHVRCSFTGIFVTVLESDYLLLLSSLLLHKLLSLISVTIPFQCGFISFFV